MAAESVGLAASVAGLLSLGLQIAGGIVKYVDAFEGRDEELRNVKKQNDNLAATLRAMKTVLAGLQGQSLVVTAAVDRNIRSCEEDLHAVEALCIELSDRAGSSWTNRLENKKKKATFAFHRPKLRDLELRLQEAHGTLQLIQGSLGLETLHRNTALLAAIESSSRDQASEMLLIRSGVAALATPVAGIDSKLLDLQSIVDQTGQLVVAHSGAIEIEVHESSQRVRYDLQHSHNSILERLKTIDHKVQLLGEENSNLRALALRAASKPAALKSLCDDMKLSRKRCNPGNASQLSKSHRGERTSSNPPRNSRFGLGVGRVCICPHPKRSFMQTQMQRGYTYLSGEWESQGHWSSCPLSRMPRNQRLKAGVKYTGVSRLLKSVIEISFVLTSGAGGCSISPSFTYYPTVDVKSDSAFRLMGLMRRSSVHLHGSSRELFPTACLRKLAKLLEERRTYPTAVDDQNMTLMHYAAASVRSLVISNTAYSRRSSKEMKTLAEIVPILLSYDVPAFSYDIEGFSPLNDLTCRTDEWAEDAVLALSRANFENQPAMLKRTSKISKFTNFSIAVHRSLMSFGKLPEVATAFECGPLSMAIVNNDSDEVDRILRRFPDSIAELDLYGRSPLHLAAAKPEILKRLVKAADLITLNQRDSTGTNALETAMVLSSLYCVNGTEYVRCRECSCYLCAKILLDAGCDLVPMSVMPGTPHYPLHLSDVLEASSELARRHYIFQMSKRRRLQRTGHVLTNRSLSTKQEVGEERTTSDIQRGISQAPRQRRIYNEAEEALESMSDWIFQQIWSVHLAQLFYRHGFIPKPSVFLQLLQSRTSSLWNILTPEIVCWLLEHGGDLFLRSPAGLVNETTDDGVFAAHCVFYELGRNQCLWLPRHIAAAPVSAIFERITVTCLNLTDGCCCPCSTKGCSSFTWLMKGFATYRIGSATPEQACLDHASRIADHFMSCGPELTLATYEEAIRFMTFEALDLFHSCCSTHSVVDEGATWVDIDDTEVIEEQGLLLELHEELVVEFTREAREYLGDGPNGRILSTQFWRSYWTDRMTEELKKLNGGDLTATERRDAEEIGVIWDEPTEGDEGDKCKGGNQYDRGDVEHYWFELDLICPEYNEPWPEGLRCIH